MLALSYRSWKLVKGNGEEGTGWLLFPFLPVAIEGDVCPVSANQAGSTESFSLSTKDSPVANTNT